MLDSVMTSLILLGWVTLLSIGFCLISIWMYFYHRRIFNSVALLLQAAMLPAIVLAPVLIFVVYEIFSFNLIFPSSFLTGIGEIIWRNGIASIILLFACGFFNKMLDFILMEYKNFSDKPFVIFARSLGKKPEKSLFKIVFYRSYLQTIVLILPWLFCEMLIIEVILNVPGIGLYTWNIAKQRDFDSLAYILVVAVFGYWLLFWGLKASNAWLGKRLKQYV